MKKNFRLFGAFAVLGAAMVMNGCGTTPNVGDADDRADLHRTVNATIDDFKGRDQYLGRFFDQARGYAVFPDVVIGAAGVGVGRGTGELFENGKFEGYCDITQASIGAQLGGQKFSEIIFFQNEGSITDFKNSTTEFDAKVSAIAASDGAARTADYSKGVLVFTIPKGGLMAQAAIGGQKFRYRPAGSANHSTSYSETDTTIVH